VLLNAPVGAAALEQLGGYGNVVEVLPEINAVTIHAQAGNLNTICGLPGVVSADPDEADDVLASDDPLPFPDCSAGQNMWNLDAVNVTNYGTTRTVGYTGEGVYIAVVDSGLPHNWRAYFPEQRIASQFAISFEGGQGIPGHISTQPQTWEHDTSGHGTLLVSVILGFSYLGTQVFNGVAPRATIIPVKTVGETGQSVTSTPRVKARAILYVLGLKTSGALGSAPVVINLSFGGLTPRPVTRAAIDAAIAAGIIVVASAGNDAASGMVYPAAYPEVISAGAIGLSAEFPPSDPSTIWWLLDDVPEAGTSPYFVAPFSSRQLAGQDLDVLAPGFAVPSAYTRAGQPDYTFAVGTSLAAPHVAGIAALMLEKNPTLTQSQIEAILETTAVQMAAGCASVIFPVVTMGNIEQITWSHNNNVLLLPMNICWDADAVGHGVVQADAALAATPLP
jgi:subtilisin family serine protease